MIIGTIEKSDRGAITLHVRGKPDLRHPVRGPGSSATRFRADIGSIKPEYVGRRIVTKPDGEWALESRFPLYAWQPDRRATRAHIRHFIAEAVKRKAWAASVTGEWKREASRMSLQTLEEAQMMSVRQIARKALEYARMRAFMRGAYTDWPGDKPAHDLWQRLTVESVA